MASRVSYASVIKNRGFRFLWTNQILVQLASNTLNFALIIWVFKLVDSNLAVSALLLAVYLPAVLFGMFAGVFVDIVDRRKLIVAIDLLLAIAMLFFILIKRSYPLILLNTFLVNTLAQFFMPSESSSIPMLVTKKQLFLANSLFSLTLYGSVMVGYSISGPVLNVFGLNTLFILTSILLLTAFLMAQNLPIIKATHKGKSFGNPLSASGLRKLLALTAQEGRETMGFIRGKLPIMAAIGLMSMVQGVIGVLAVVMPSYLERVLRIHATDASYFVMVPLGLGMMFGAVLIGRLFHRYPKRSLVIPALIASGILFLLVGIAPAVAKLVQSPELGMHISRPRYFFRAPSLSSFFALGAFVLGFCTVAIIIPSQTVLQECTTEENRGKIFAVLAAAMTGVSAIPVLLAGALSDIFGVTPIFIGLGAIIFIIGLLALNPSLFFKEDNLPFRVREFLGLDHWAKGNFVPR